MDELVRVLMLDDQILSRRGLELVLGATEGIEVVGSMDADAGDHLVIDLRPDVVLVGSGGNDCFHDVTCSRVRAVLPRARILLMSRGGSPTEHGPGGQVNGWLDRGSPADDVAEQILRVASR